MTPLTVRPATAADLPALAEIYRHARAFMAAAGNPTQWGTTNPPMATLEEDIRCGQLFLAGNGSRHGVFGAAVAFAAARYPHLRIDTHQNNRPMRTLIPRAGFAYCGVIHLADGSPRLAYERLP